ncbi:hypothetical protein EV702DRAFT_1043424 [Suillus placidus]|uniref:Uncharacterized protein n=1 Tax=Suillus placidus TaxID=48579 RepID=A0A9P7A0N2_9AGAM|nr:hypothetical protein EV702DRAFT_1043424 [Suillus placidus]
MSQKHIPYTSRPAPLELQFAARVSGQGCRPEFTVEEINEAYLTGQKREEAISRGFSHLSLATLYQLFKSKLAGHEAARQRLVMMTLELEASERYTTFLDGLYHENKDRLLFSDEELSWTRNVFSDRSQEEIDDDMNYFQAVYDNECEMLHAVAAQAEVLKRHLGSRVQEDLFVFHIYLYMCESSGACLFNGGIVAFFFTTTWMPGGHSSQCKGKVTIPKPTRGSGLNPSGLPAASQLNLPTEQPQMSVYDFNLHGQTGLQWQGVQQNTQNLQYQQDEGQMSYGDKQAQVQAYGGEQGESQSYGGTQEQAQSYGGTQEQDQAYGGTQDQAQAYGGAQALSSYGGAQGSSSYADEQPYNFYDHFRDVFDPNPADFLPEAGPSVHPEGIAPIPIMDQGNGLSPPASDLALIRQGEIPLSDVVHTAGPARTMMTCTRRSNMPPTPYITSHTPAVTTDAQPHSTIAEQDEASSDSDHEMPQLQSQLGSQKAKKKIRLSPEVIKQTIEGAKVLATHIVFSKCAMVCSKQKKRHIIDRVIKYSVPQFFGPGAVFETFITSEHRAKVANALSAKCGKLVDFACHSVCDAFDLFPPRGHILTAEQYRTNRINRFIHGNDPLLFMHDVFVDVNNNINVRTKFQSRFVMTNIIRFIWYWGNTSFIQKAPLKALKHVLAVASAATHCALHEQGNNLLEVNPFGGQAHERKFDEIVDAIEDLTPAEEVELDAYLHGTDNLLVLDLLIIELITKDLASVVSRM